MGDKITSKKIAAEAGVSTVPGHMGLIDDADQAVKIAGEIGYPVMIKAIRRRRRQGDADRLERRRGPRGLPGVEERGGKSSLATTGSSSRNSSTQPRHIEIQVIADSHGNASISASGNARSSGATRR
jgi:propionyl-CoA carboxylase alpha chain